MARKSTPKAEAPTHAEQLVAEFEGAKTALTQFLKDQDVRNMLAELYQLVDDHNRALDQAVRGVKSQLRTSDQQRLVIGVIGAQKKLRRWYDVEHLARALPAEQADAILTEKVVYELNEEVLSQMVRQGEVDNEIVAQAYHEEEQDPSSMPGTPKPYNLPPLPVD